jgi:hypothetical protein
MFPLIHYSMGPDYCRSDQNAQPEHCTPPFLLIF